MKPQHQKKSGTFQKRITTPMPRAVRISVQAIAEGSDAIVSVVNFTVIMKNNL